MRLNLPMEKLNLGCGPDAPPNWVNVDGSWNAWFAHHRYLLKVLERVGLVDESNKGARWNVAPVVHDLREPLPFQKNTFSAVYACHVLEHLYLSEAQRLLSECKRVLRSEGVIRVLVPDLRSMVADYLKARNGGNPTASDPASAADLLNERLGFRKPDPPSGNFVFRLYALGKDFHTHKWMYDSDSLICYMVQAGFADVKEKGFRESEIPGIEEVENPGRVLGGAGICVEGRKPWWA